jgi:hypothetical protein
MAVNVTLSPLPILQFFDNTGKPAVGGSLLTQVGGVNYATYSDVGGTTALPNPIPLNSRGEVSTAAGASSELFLEDNVSYTFTLKDADGNQLWSIGNVVAPSPNVGFKIFTANGTYTPATTGTYAIYAIGGGGGGSAGGGSGASNGGLGGGGGSGGVVAYTTQSLTAAT